MRYSRIFASCIFVALMVLSVFVLPVEAETTSGSISMASLEHAPTWYLAEGSTDWGFSTGVSIENPNEADVNVKITYYTLNGVVDGGTANVPAESQVTIYPRAVLGKQDFSTKVECLEGMPIAVERGMGWRPEDIVWEPEYPPPSQGHSSIGASDTSTKWYFPEGSSAWGFSCWLAILNPGEKPARCEVTYMIEGEGPKRFVKEVPAQSRQTVSMFTDIGAKDASIMVSSDNPVVAERSMYLPKRVEGSCSIGATVAANNWYFAEGATAFGFETFVLLQNPNNAPVMVLLGFSTPQGPVNGAAFVMPALSRKTVRLNDLHPEMELSTHVHSDLPIVAERSIYSEERPAPRDYNYRCCNASIGVNAPHRIFYFPKGGPYEDKELSDESEYWTVIQNPNDCEVTVQINYLGTLDINNRIEVIPPNSRISVGLTDSNIPGSSSKSSIETNPGTGIVIECITPGKKIAADQSIYWADRKSGTCTTGAYSD